VQAGATVMSDVNPEAGDGAPGAKALPAVTRSPSTAAGVTIGSGAIEDKLITAKTKASITPLCYGASTLLTRHPRTLVALAGVKIRVWYDKWMIASPASSNKVYTGRSVKGRKEVTVRDLETTVPLRCLDFCTPTFAWGYHGGAPDELAIAILADYFGSPSTVVERRVLALYRAFAHEVVAKFSHNGSWSLPSELVTKWIGSRELAS
jgi:hypothetical protein